MNPMSASSPGPVSPADPFDGALALRLPWSFSPRRLAADLARVPARAWRTHGYSGNYGLSAARVPPHCAYLRSVVAALPSPPRRVRLFKVAAGGCLLPHDDAELPSGLLRVHVPIKTNREVHMVFAGRRVLMPAGRACALNVSLPHEIYNLGREDRVHLIADSIPRPEFWASMTAVERVRPEDAPDARVMSLVARRLEAFESASPEATPSLRLRRKMLAALLLARLASRASP